MQLVLRITISLPCATGRQINPFDPLSVFVMQAEMPFRLEMLPEGDYLLSDFEVGPSIGAVLGGIASAFGTRSLSVREVSWNSVGRWVGSQDEIGRNESHCM